MLGWAYDLQRPINLFISSADQLFSPITSVRCPSQPIKHIPWITFTLKTANWEHVNDMQMIIFDANKIQHLFSSDDQLALWHAIPTIKEFQTTWETKRDLDKYVLYKVALNCVLKKIAKYYSKFDEKDIYVLALVLHPYYKLTYIKMAWGGADEQRKEIEAGNMNAKDWHDEAMKMVEKTVKEYWNNCRDSIAGDVDQQYSRSNHDSSHPLKSEYDRHCRQLLEKTAIQVNTGRWKEEFRHYLTEIPSDVSKETNIIAW
ncbi:hypothetical protein SCLCIDRAFT_26022 [Scleroderma citrinum Foug A]|uniref:hAT-like transposase RNase-H fold domain-containing protein n=1 Tax=Scleroderma citrinum Foug A TaxID=1036808 RepID=A0A0C3A8M8_9AGAM|nr:hypothetical protein SCLCIDRAFT_26022 [Scleroderma citrinum Foug A]